MSLLLSDCQTWINILKLGTPELLHRLRVLVAVLAFMLSCPTIGLAEVGAQPPCGMAAQPPYAPPGTAPALLIWTAKAKWVPPLCTDWRSENAEIGTALAGSFR